jgi:hypothetical protein
MKFETLRRAFPMAAEETLRQVFAFNGGHVEKSLQHLRVLLLFYIALVNTLHLR